MTNKEFKDTLDKLLKSHGFKKKAIIDTLSNEELLKRGLLPYEINKLRNAF